ncbi:unnamed protein product [Prorocentrum cordatum]|uniref:Uncharacterized protein n=1 Tax=Prorocentrum cordatum TaxID=2364126 RepID=A0ABN9UBE0_9DINO|nr:unnamed protein product [Polarella glacialis]
MTDLVNKLEDQQNLYKCKCGLEGIFGHADDAAWQMAEGLGVITVSIGKSIEVRKDKNTDEKEEVRREGCGADRSAARPRGGTDGGRGGEDLPPGGSLAAAGGLDSEPQADRSPSPWPRRRAGDVRGYEAVGTSFDDVEAEKERKKAGIPAHIRQREIMAECAGVLRPKWLDGPAARGAQPAFPPPLPAWCAR